jgi:anti-sigma regulatory factor (Ser/Thr protein kinase)
VDTTTEGFRHEALLYDGDGDFLCAALPFVGASLDAGEPIMVALPRPRLDLLRAHLHDRADDVAFVDMQVLGANPARIIPAWEDFVAEHAGPGGRLRGIGEPIWAGRSGPQLAECQLHESLLNLAFADGPPFWLLCPYDTRALDASVITAARCSHPVVSDQPSEHYEPAEVASVLSGPLPEPAGAVEEHAFDATALPSLRELVREHAAGLGPEQLEGLLVAVTEAATNSIRHGGGTGRLRVWCEGGTLVCEVRDAGTIADPLAGRRRPAADQVLGGWGLWIANALVDLVQLRTSAGGTTVRLHTRIR